jgi:arabinose-5-phosphate isomerase
MFFKANFDALKNSKDIRGLALKTFHLEAEAINDLAIQLNNKFEEAITTLANTRGRIVISGIGKSAIIAQKIVATLNSTGSPSIFL